MAQAKLCWMGTQLPPQKGVQQPSTFWPMSVVAKQLDGSRYKLVQRQATAVSTKQGPVHDDMVSILTAIASLNCVIFDEVSQ